MYGPKAEQQDCRMPYIRESRREVLPVVSIHF